MKNQNSVVNNMAWEKANLMFPDGETNIGRDDSISIDELQNYSEVIMPRYHFARGMIIRKDMLTWTSDNNYMIETLYDVNSYNNKPEEDSCLSVYGNRMVLDYFQRNQFITRRKSGEVQRAGFNYTGL